MEEFRIHTFEAECRLLRELMDMPENIPAIRQIVRAEMFFDKKTREIWEALCDRFDAGEADAIGVEIFYLKASDKNWYSDHILRLPADRSFLKIQEYAAAIVSGYQSAKVFSLSEQLRSLAINGTTTAEALEIVRRYEEDTTSSAPQSTRIRSALDAYNELWEELEADRGYLPTGFPSLDYLTYGGLAAGNLVIIAARPSVGKTALGLFMARNMAAAGKRILFFSLEMTAAELTKRMLIGTGLVQAKDFRRENLNIQAIEEAGKKFNKLPLYIDDTSRRLEDIRAGIVIENSRQPIDAVFVDYLGLILSSSDNRTPQYLKIAEITGRLKSMAKELHIPVILLCQLNRDSAKENREPELYDLRDSGAIEQDADIALLLHQEEDPYLIKVLVEKNRQGKKDVHFHLKRNESYTQFEEYDKEDD